MARNTKTSFELDDLAKGVNVFTRDTMIKDSECALASNVWGVGKSSIAKRPGFSQLMEIDSVDRIDGIGAFYSSSARELLAMAGGKLYKESSGEAVQVSGSPTSAGNFSSNYRTDFCQAGGKLFIQNTVNALREYDGTNIAVTSNGKKGAFSIFYKGCLWVAGDPEYPTRLYRSGSDTDLGNFTYNETENPLATSVFVGKNDGQKITGVFKHQDYLYVVKENSIWSVSQSTDEFGTITLELIDPSRGCVNHWTIDSVENDVFFFNDYGAYAFGYEPNITNQIRTNIVSLRVDPYIKNIQKDRLDDIACIYFDNHYYLAYTEAGGNSNDKILVYDRQRLGWWVWDGLSAACFTEFKDSDGYSRMYFGSDEDGKIMYLDENAKSDGGTAITTRCKSKKYPFGDYTQSKFFHHVILYFGKTPGTVTINVFVDGNLHKTVSQQLGNTKVAGMGIGLVGEELLGEGSSAEDVSDTGGGDFVKIPINKIGYNLQFEVRDSELNKGWELNSINGIFKGLNKIYFRG